MKNDLSGGISSVRPIPSFRIIEIFSAASIIDIFNKVALHDDLGKITAPTLIIWGKEDKVTPYFVGEKFNELINGSVLIGVDKCGHAPMMEHPKEFNNIVEKWFAEKNF